VCRLPVARSREVQSIPPTNVLLVDPSEAARAALRWLDERFAAPRSVCLIHEDNWISLRLAETLGYRPFERREYKGYPAVLFERERP
jgi:RimJ/RimL family protein N-acetyltransferase